MQGFKKSLVALLAVAMVLSLVGTAFAAPADVAGTKYEDAAVRLIALGVFKGDDKGNFNPENPITRAEAAAIIVRALGLEKSAELMKGVTKFADVNADPGLQWATGAINVAVSSGIVNGYPNGQFGGRDNVTYAQLAKMILYALNYGVVVEGGVWPTAVLAKADDLDILDGMTVVADAPITRGDAAKMLDNSLDVASLRQTGYGDLKQFEEDGKTLLERMGLDEVEGRVVEVPEVNNRIDDDEVVIEVTKENGVELKDSKKETYAELEGVDVQGLFGLKVKAWIKDDEVVFVEKKTQDEYVDTIDKTTNISKNKVDLVVLDDDVTFDEDATIYVNFEKADLEDLEVGYFGRFVEDKNKIVFASLFDFGDRARGVVVSEVTGNKIKYFDRNKTKKTLDLTDADAVTVYNTDLSKASLDDIEKDTVLYWWEEDDEFHIVIVNETAEGEVSKIQDKKVTIDGTGYTFNEDGTFSFDKDDTVEEYTESAGTIKDFDGEAVVALLNLKGQIRHLRGDAKTTSGTQYGIVVDAPKYSQVTIFTKDGEEVTYDIDKRADYSWFGDYKFYAAKDNADKHYAAVAYKVNSDSEIVASDVKIGLEHAASVSFVKLGGQKVILEGGAEQYKGFIKKADDSTLITLKSANTDGEDIATFYVSSSTVVMRALNDENELDPEVISWEDFKKLNVEQGDASQAIVFGEDGKAAKFIVFVSEDFEGTGDDVYYAVAKSNTYRSGGKWRVELDVYGEGIGTYVVDAEGAVDEGDVFAFNLNSKGQVSVTSPVALDVAVKDAVKDGYIYRTKYYKVDDDAVIYQLKVDKTEIDRAIDLADLEEKELGKVYFVVRDKDSLVKAVVYAPVSGAVTPAGKAKVTYINGGIFEVELPSGAEEADYAVEVVGVGAKEIVGGLATGFSLTAGNVYTANLVKLSDLDTAVATQNFIAKAAVAYNVTYDGNGADSGTVEDTADYAYGDEVTVKTNAFVKAGKDFAGWNTKADGTGTAYAADAKLTIKANVTLYAVWVDAA